MNQPSLSKDKKSTSGRLSVASNTLRGSSSTTEIKHKGLSLNKRCQQIEDICLTKNSQGKYLMGWGKIPSLSNTSKVQLINKDIVSFDCGEDHIIFVNHRHQAFAFGKNQFGQLGSKHNHNNVIIPVFEGYQIKKVFCTSFTTFFLTQSLQLYCCGLNNRGQLGLSHEENIFTPISLETFNQESRISSVYYNDLKRSKCGDLQSKDSQKMLQNGERIKYIKGGPFHTTLLTSKGRVFYSGNFYKSDSILKDEFTNTFILLNTTTIGKVVSIRSYLTGICLQNSASQLFLLGHFGVHIFDEPFLIQSRGIVSYGVNDGGIFIVNSQGQLIFYNIQVDNLRGQKIHSSQPIKQIHCGLDYLLAITNCKNIFGLGNNSEQQLCNSQVRNTKVLIKLPINIKNQEHFNFSCSNNFVLCLATKPIDGQKQEGLDITKYKDLQRENKVLKELLCNKNKKNAKIQTEKEGKFQVSKALNPRTFDNSMEIPFKEITIGRQISEGGYGVIYEAIWRKTTVAVKLFKIDQENDNSIRDFISQCHAMEALRHPNLVMFLGACTKPPHYAIVLEYCPGGTLWSLLQNKSIEISWKERKQFALDIAKGMNYLHEKPIPILHRDLKSLNLLLDQNKKIKLADFGWTKGLQNYMTGKIGTYQWMAPQVISAFKYTEKADVYSFGIILWEIASRQAPYRNIPGPQVAQQVLSRDLRPLIPKGTPQCFSSLIRSCWVKQGSARPDFSTIISRLQNMSFN